MSETIYSDRVVDLLKRSPSAFHVVQNMKEILLSEGYCEIREDRPFDLEPGEKYFVTRNGSSIIAFRVPNERIRRIAISSTHNDSPTFKVKPNPVMGKQNLLSLNVEPYGGMIMSSWLDRPLSIAGRVMIERDLPFIESRLFDYDRDFCVIPSVAIHMNRGVNDGYAYNPAIDLIPLFSIQEDEFSFNSFLAAELGVKEDEILGFDLQLYVRDSTKIVGKKSEFLLSPKLDDLSSAYASLYGFIDSHPGQDLLPIFASFDNEEVGSMTKQGADSDFLESILLRIKEAVGLLENEYRAALASSWMLSVDNAHANHPNHPEYSDPTTKVFMGQGIVIKYNANQKYTTDAPSAAMVKEVAKAAGLNVQEFTNRSDLRGGGTLGAIANSHISIRTVDIGIPQLAMHSSVEICAVSDINDMGKLIEYFFSLNIPAIE